MAIGASDLAIVQLINEPLCTAATPHQRSHRFQLCTDVVELENQRIRESTVNAASVHESVEQNAEVALIARHSRRDDLPRIGVNGPGLVVPWSSHGRVALVAVGAEHFALC